MKLADHALLEPRYGAAAVGHESGIYIIGGVTGLGHASDVVEHLDPRTRRSTALLRLKSPRFYHRAVVVDDRIYVLGGQTQVGTAGISPGIGDSTAAIGRSSVTPPETQPSKRAGAPRFHFLPTVEIINLRTATSERGPPMPVAKSHFGAAIFDGKLYVIGGRKQKGNAIANTNTVEVLDLATKKWSTGIAMPTPRQCMAVVVDDFILVPGGFDGGRKLATVEFFSPKERAWKRLPDLGDGWSAYSLAFLDKHLFLFGEYDARHDVLAYNLATRESSTFTFGFTAARHTAAVVHGGLIYVAGGLDPGTGPRGDIQVFALRTDPRARDAVERLTSAPASEAR